MTNVLLSEIMTPQPITVSYEDTLSNVAEIFENENIHHVPVVDEADCLCGIISKTDMDKVTHGLTLFRNPNIDEYNKSLYETTLVSTVMTKDVYTLMPSDTLEKAYKVFKSNKYRAVPVIDKGTLVGIVTPLDIIDHLLQMNSHG